MSAFEARHCFSRHVQDYTDASDVARFRLPSPLRSASDHPPTGATGRKLFLTGSIPALSFLHVVSAHLNVTNASERHAVVLCKSVAELRQSVVGENDSALGRDDFLFDGGGSLGMLKDDLTVIQLPSLAHLRFFLASMHCDGGTSPLTRAGEDQERKLSRAAYLGRAPTVAMLHSPTDWLDDADSTDTIDEYMSILAQFVSQFTAIAPSAELVIIDNAANRIDLPVLPESKRKGRDNDEDSVGLMRAAAFFVDSIIESKRVEGETPYAAGREPYVDHSLLVTRSIWSRDRRGPESELVYRKHHHFETTPESCSFEILSQRAV